MGETNNEYQELLSEAMQGESSEGTQDEGSTESVQNNEEGGTEEGAESGQESSQGTDGDGEGGEKSAGTETGEEGSEGEEGELSEVDRLKRQNELLKQQLQTGDSPKAKAQKYESTPLDESVFGEQDFSELQEDPDKLKSFMLEFANKIKSQTEESLLKALPDQVNELTTQQIELRRVADNFYGDHPELAEIKPYIKQVTSQVASENPSWPLDKVLAETASRAYKAMGMTAPKAGKKSEAKTEATSKKKPAFAEQKGGSKQRNKQESELSDVEQQIEDILS